MSKRERYYELVMSMLALIAVSLLLIEYTTPITDQTVNQFAAIDTAILTIFALDYIFHFATASRKWVYLKSNIFELIAIIPFSSIFRIARVGRIFRITRLSKLTKLIKLGRSLIFLNKFKAGIVRFFRLNGFQYALFITVIVALIGSILIMFAEQMSFQDALWWSIVTITTVGYGDLSPASGVGRFLAVILMLVGIGFLGMVTGTIATFFIKQEKTSLKQESIDLIKKKLDSGDYTNNDLEYICKLVMSLESDDENKRVPL